MTGETPSDVAEIVGLRNRIIHSYADVDPGIVWAIVQNEVPPLLEKSESLLEKAEYDE